MTPENDNLGGEIAALKTQVFTLMVALIVVSGTLTVYLYRQAVLAGKDLNQAREASAELAKTAPGINNFVAGLVAYEQRHPDFAPILRKYGIQGAPPPAAAPKK